MTDEEAMFDVWFQLERRRDFERRFPGESFREGWSMGYRDSMLKGWLARAGLHVTYARGADSASENAKGEARFTEACGADNGT